MSLGAKVALWGSAAAIAVTGAVTVGPRLVKMIGPKTVDTYATVAYMGPQKQKMIAVANDGTPYFLATQDGRFRVNKIGEGDCVHLTGQVEGLASEKYGKQDWYRGLPGDTAIKAKRLVSGFAHPAKKGYCRR